MRPVEGPSANEGLKKRLSPFRETAFFAVHKKRRANGSPLDTSKVKKKLRRNRSLVLLFGFLILPRTFLLVPLS